MSQNTERLQANIHEKKRMLRDTITSTEVCVCVCVCVHINHVYTNARIRVWIENTAVWISVLNKQSIKRHIKAKTSVMLVLRGMYVYVCTVCVYMYV